MRRQPLAREQIIERQFKARLARAAKQARRRAEFYGVRHEDVSYEEIRARDGNNCYLCRRFVSVHDMTFDHVVPLVGGGEHVKGNLRLAHRDCNSRKGKQPLWTVK
jgi:5-methylcytosine-specific restriction endonuclease McrA